jgi:hypothetical protein
MSWHHPKSMNRKITLGHVQVGAAYTAGEHPNHQFVLGGTRNRLVRPAQGAGSDGTGCLHPPHLLDLAVHRDD